MHALPKPPPCHQNWLAMQPTKNGRMCAQCNKEIHNFSAMSWEAIVQTQAAHSNALCGMYSPAQLKHWGQQPPSACAQLAAATTLALALAAVPASAQTVTATKLVLRGTVMGADQATPEPLPGVTVLVAGTTTIGTSTDANGQYELAIPDTLSSKGAVRILFSSVGFDTIDFTLSPQSHGVLRHDTVLEANAHTMVYMVAMPTLTQRIKWKFKRLFSRED